MLQMLWEEVCQFMTSGLVLKMQLVGPYLSKHTATRQHFLVVKVCLNPGSLGHMLDHSITQPTWAIRGQEHARRLAYVRLLLLL
jgi:hypothetical protein